MCQRCVDRSGDPRKAAFQPFFTVTWITQTQAKQAQKYAETDSDKTMHLETVVLNSDEETRAKLDALENDPTVFRYTVDKTVVCLN